MIRVQIGRVALGLLGLGLLAGPSRAQKGPVALVPAFTFKGSSDNGPVVTDAVRASLEKAGYRVLSDREMEGALRKLKVDLSKPQFLPTLNALGAELNVAYVFYPRVQGVGTGVNTNDKEEFQATILINVANAHTKNLYHVNQIGQVFRHPGKMADMAVINKDAAGQAAERLLEGFYKKQKATAQRSKPASKPASKAVKR